MKWGAARLQGFFCRCVSAEGNHLPRSSASRRRAGLKPRLTSLWFHILLIPLPGFIPLPPYTSQSLNPVKTMVPAIRKGPIRPVVLSWRGFCRPGDIWQCLEPALGRTVLMAPHEKYLGTLLSYHNAQDSPQQRILYPEHQWCQG